MFSYRHAFHAGNHADILKHLFLVNIIDYLQQKAGGFLYLDSHSARGLYDLSSADADKTGEYRHGFAKVQNCPNPPPMLARLLQVRGGFEDIGTHHYIGSPLLAGRLLRQVDRAILCEWHPNEELALKKNCRRYLAGKKVAVLHQDGLAALKAYLPNPERRALVFIDPAYEQKTEAKALQNAIIHALQKMPHALMVLWYPLIANQFADFARTIAAKLPDKVKNAVDIRMQIQQSGAALAAEKNGVGMYGSALLVINAPYQLAQNARAELAFLCQQLAQDDCAQFAITELKNT